MHNNIKREYAFIYKEPDLNNPDKVEEACYNIELNFTLNHPNNWAFLLSLTLSKLSNNPNNTLHDYSDILSEQDITKRNKLIKEIL